jgi:hypothetical protein
MSKKLFVQDWLLEELPRSYYVVAEDIKRADDSFDACEIQTELCGDTIVHPLADPKPVIELTDDEAKLLEEVYLSKQDLKSWLTKPGYESLKKKLEGVL